MHKKSFKNFDINWQSDSEKNKLRRIKILKKNIILTV